eukprot:gene2233-1394_t
MFLRVRSKGGSPENSQAALMYMRAFRTAPSEATPGAYTIVSVPTASSKAETCAVGARRFMFPTFCIGIHTAASGASLPAHSLVGPDALQVSWKEIWNTLDILYDEVQLLPVKTAAKADACVRKAGFCGAAAADERPLDEDDTAAAAQRFIATASSGGVAYQLQGNNKVAVCPHYFDTTARPVEAFAPLLASKAPCAATTDLHGGGATSPSMRVVLDVSTVAELEKVGVELAWLLAYLTLQPGMSRHDAADGGPALLVVRLPLAHVPYVVDLEAAAAGGNTSELRSAVAIHLLAMLDFLGQHVSMLWEGGARCAPPVVCFVGREDDMPTTWRALHRGLQVQPSSSSHALAPLLWAVSDEVSEAQRGERAKVLQATVAATTTSSSSSAAASAAASAGELWTVPLKAFKEGGEEPWDPYTQRERARLNFCPCCGDCGHGHGGQPPKEEIEGANESHSHGHGHGHGH